MGNPGIEDVNIGEFPIIGAATLLEIVTDGAMSYVTVSYDPPKNGESLGTIRGRSADGEMSKSALIRIAEIMCRYDGYELIVPDDYFTSR